MKHAQRQILIEATIAAGNRGRAADHAQAVAERYNAKHAGKRLTAAAAQMAMRRAGLRGLDLAAGVVDGVPGIACRRCQSWRSWAQIEALGWAAFAGPHAVCAES